MGKKVIPRQPKRLWLLCLKTGMGLKTLSEAAGLGRNCVAEIAVGPNRGTAETWRKIAAVMREAGVTESIESMGLPLTPDEAAWCRIQAERMQSLRSQVRYLKIARVATERWWSTTEDRQMIGSDVLRHFGLARDPFLRPANRGDVYVYPRLRALEELIQETARRRGLLAIAGDVGSGKTVAVRRALQPLAEDQNRYRVSFLVSLDRERVNARSILEAVLRDMAGEHETVPSSQESLTRKVVKVVTHLVERNVSPILVIDEAQALSARALRPIKRIMEVTGERTGLLPGLGVILVGQSPELVERLAEPDVREVRARVHIEVLGGLRDDLPGYIQWLFERAGARRTVVTKDAVAAMLLHHRRPVGRNKFLEGDKCGPLTVEDDLTRAMHLARERGQKEINAQVLHEVLSSYVSDATEAEKGGA